MDRVKDSLAIAKDTALISLFLLLLCFPSGFNTVLERAGFTEGSLMGFTWRQKALQSKAVADSSQQLAENARLEMEQMQIQLDSISKKLLAIASETHNPEVKDMAETLDSSKTILQLSNNALRHDIRVQDNKLNEIFRQDQFRQ